MVAHKIHIDKVLNISGLIPPQSNFLITKTLEKIQQGCTLEIVSREKKILQFIPQLCESSSCKVIETRVENGLLHCTVAKI